MAKRPPRELQVIGSKRITLTMHRVTLGGPGMVDFPKDAAGGYIKLNFPPAEDGRPVTRTYSVRTQRDGEIDIDFVLHGDGGPASRWAVSCQPCETIMVGGPGPKTSVDHDADWILMAGDMTALPAISVNIEELPADAAGYIAIEIIDEADIQDLPIPAGFDVEWLVNPEPGEAPHLLADHVRNLSWRDGRPSVWVACEFNSMRTVRDYLQKDRQLTKDELYISSYWMHGANEDSHRVAKREDREALPVS